MKANFQRCLILALVIGFLWPSPWLWLVGLVDYMVMTLILLGFLTRAGEGQIQGLSWQQQMYEFAFAKLGLPLATFLALQLLVPQYAAAAMMIMALPAAGVSPALARLCGGDLNVSLRILLAESLLVCLTIPGLFWLTGGADHAIPVFGVARYVAFVLLIPLILSYLLRRWRPPDFWAAQAQHASGLSVVIISVLVAVIMAKVKPALTEDWLRSLVLLAVCYAAAPSLALVGLWLGPARRVEVAISLAVKNLYVNIGLGLGLALAYLPQAGALLLLTYLIPVNTLAQPVSRLARRVSARKASHVSP